jgi:hypothetical protein
LRAVTLNVGRTQSFIGGPIQPGMAKPKMPPSSPQKALRGRLDLLAGTWDAVGKHPKLPGKVLHGKVAFTWMAGDSFLVMDSRPKEPEVPASFSVFGYDDEREGYSMLYHDSRNVSRIYEMSLTSKSWNLWRDAPGFAQRFEGKFTNRGRTIVGRWELCKDGKTWNRDLEMTYTRAR